MNRRVILMYLKITNKGEVSRKFYELIGASSKRDRMDDPTVIGNKGSGAKLAVIPTLRLGLEVAISSSDLEGQYILRYITKEVSLGDKGTVNQIFFKYDSDGEFPSQLTTDAFQDWDKPIGDDQMKIFKALREYLVNAWDEDKDFTIEEVETICQTESGTTSVFITITEEIRQILNSLPRYFKILNDCQPLFSVSSDWDFVGGGIYSKSEPNVTRLFSQGVMIDCKTYDAYSTIFDYSLNDKYLLSEERIIKDFSDFRYQVGQLLMKLDDTATISQLFEALIKSEDSLELDAIGHVKNPPEAMVTNFKIMWKLYFGIKAVLGVGVLQIDGDAKNLGYTVVSNLPSLLVSFLKRCGVSTASDVVPKIPKEEEEDDLLYEIIKLNEEQQQYFDEAYKKFLRYFPEAASLPIHFYRALDWRWENAAGHSGVGAKEYKEIWIAEKSLSSVEKILKVLVHEGRHCYTQAGDYDRKFTQFADEQLVQLIMADTTPPRKNEWRAQVIKNRGVLIPKRYVNQPVHVFIFENELRLKIGVDTFLTTKLEESITGNVSQKREVSSFKSFGCVYLPPSITNQLDNEIWMELN